MEPDVSNGESSGSSNRSNEDAKSAFLRLLGTIPPEDLLAFKTAAMKAIDVKLSESHIRPKSTHTTVKRQKLEELKFLSKQKEDLLQVVIQELRNTVPVTAEAPQEKITIPQGVADYAGYNNSNTVSVDGFLYEDDEFIDDLCEEGKMFRNYCVDCGSKNTKPLNFITHSATVTMLRFIFGNAVLGEIPGKTLVDIGSRLGAVLYTGHLMTKAAKLIGIEKNDFFANLQKDFITKKFKFADRIEVIHADVLTQQPVLASADVVVMNNVFEFFESDPERHAQLWHFIRTSLTKSGTQLVIIPSLEESLEKANVKINLKKWVKEIPLSYPDSEEYEMLQDIHLYKVL